MISLYDVDTIEVFGFVRCLSLSPKALVDIHCRLAYYEKQELERRIGPFERFLASKLLESSAPMTPIIDSITMSTSVEFKLEPNLALSLQCAPDHFGEWEAAWKLIYNHIQRALGMRATFATADYYSSAHFALVLKQISRNIEEMVLVSDL
ncbi:hypothetical protein FRB95_011399 [Tulasnella sp. JGI-2019a]|nr:hypothetical protein FRB95_011399 [Tulasnella sp. JGI-2019a]